MDKLANRTKPGPSLQV